MDFGTYSPGSEKGEALNVEIQQLIDKVVMEDAPPTPGFFSCVFVVTKATGSFCPVIDLSVPRLASVHRLFLYWVGSVSPPQVVEWSLVSFGKSTTHQCSGALSDKIRPSVFSSRLDCGSVL